MTSKKLKDQRKEEAEYIKNGIAESKCSEMKFGATDSEILFVIIDYLIHPRDGVRKTAKRTGHSKTWVWRVLRNYPAKFDDDLPKYVFMELHNNRLDVAGITTLNANVTKHLAKAHMALSEDRTNSKHISRPKAKFLLWFK